MGEIAPLESILARPLEQKLREYKYRCAQALIFGLPVIVLQYFGHSLGGTPREASRWIAILQALLAGWVTYIAAAGMLFEGLVLLSQGIRADLIVAAIAIAFYLFSAISTLGVFIKGQPFFSPLLFHWTVIILAAWCAIRWRQTLRALTDQSPSV
jgi:hypothetical protein